jgi:hypothetical protein
MEAERKRQILLAVLAIVLAGVVYRQWPATTTSSGPSPASNQRAGGRSGGTASDRNRQGTAAEGTIDVRLESLEAERPKPGPTDRNLFRFREKPPPAPPPPLPPNRGGTPLQPGELNPPPVGPPQPPPIGLKFIGVVVEQGTEKRKIAVLSDGSGQPLLGAEGDLVAGRYRILKIGEESIELAYADGRGRQTIRLTGS